MFLIFTYIILVVMLLFVPDTLSAKTRKREAGVQVRFGELSNETPLVEVKLSLLFIGIVGVIWFIFFFNLGELLRLLHHLFFKVLASTNNHTTLQEGGRDCSGI
jgi:hypothetical protein